MLRNANICSRLTTVGFHVMSFGIKCLRAVAIKSPQTTKKRQQLSTALTRYQTAALQLGFHLVLIPCLDRVGNVIDARRRRPRALRGGLVQNCSRSPYDFPAEQTKRFFNCIIFFLCSNGLSLGFGRSIRVYIC